MHFFERERLLGHNERRKRTRARPKTQTHTQTRIVMQSQIIFSHQTRIVSRSKNGTIIAASTPKLRKQTNHHQTSAVTRPKSNNIPSSSSRRRRSSSSSSSSSWVMSTTIVMASSSTGLFDCPIFAEKTLDKFQQSTSSTTKATTEEASFVRE